MNISQGSAVKGLAYRILIPQTSKKIARKLQDGIVGGPWGTIGAPLPFPSFPTIRLVRKNGIMNGLRMMDKALKQEISLSKAAIFGSGRWIAYASSFIPLLSDLSFVSLITAALLIGMKSIYVMREEDKSFYQNI